MVKQCGGAHGVPGTPHQAWLHLGSCTLGSYCHPRANGFPSCPLTHGNIRSLFGTEVTVGKRLQERSWQASNLETLLSALSPSTRSFHFLLMGTHLPSPGLSAQPHHAPASTGISLAVGAGLGAQDTQEVPGSSHTHLEQVYLHSVCQVPVVFSVINGAFSTWCEVGQPLIRSTFKLLLQPFSSPVEMLAQWAIPCPSHRDDVPTVLLEQDSLGMRSPVPCPAHSPPVPEPCAEQQSPSYSSSASWGSRRLGCQGGTHQRPGA